MRRISAILSTVVLLVGVSAIPAGAGAAGSGEMTAYIIFPGDFDPANFPWKASWIWEGTIEY